MFLIENNCIPLYWLQDLCARVPPHQWSYYKYSSITCLLHLWSSCVDRCSCKLVHSFSRLYSMPLRECTIIYFFVLQQNEHLGCFQFGNLINNTYICLLLHMYKIIYIEWKCWVIWYVCLQFYKIRPNYSKWLFVPTNTPHWQHMRILIILHPCPCLISFIF